MSIKFNFKKGILILFLLYTFFFVACAFLAPIFAAVKQFYLADIIYILMRRSCTQDALRCFWIFGYQMSICARCLGAYVGSIISIIVWLKGIKIGIKEYLILAVFSFGEIILEATKCYSGNNVVRFFAGIALGGFVVFSLYYLFESERKVEKNV